MKEEASGVGWGGVGRRAILQSRSDLMGNWMVEFNGVNGTFSCCSLLFYFSFIYNNN